MIIDWDKWNAVVDRGDGKCFACRGDGVDNSGRRCRDCKGTGRCKRCRGTGINGGSPCDGCLNNGGGVADKVYYERVLRYIPLDEFLAVISEEERAREVGKPCDAARESFHLTQMTVPGLPEFEAILFRFMSWYCQDPCCYEHFYPIDSTGGANDLLRKIYESPDIPLRMAKTGEAGGMRRIFNMLHEHMKGLAMKDYVKRMTSYFKTPELGPAFGAPPGFRWPRQASG